jgi:hypothetical protein
MGCSVDDLLSPAQTNLQLYEQLRHAGRNPAAARSGYELAMRLFAGQYRASGKPFVAHLVGTASILASLGASEPVVVAGLLHAAYTNGVFAGWRRAVTRRKRREVRAAVGTEVEALVFGYTRFPWRAELLPGLRDGGARPADRDLITMRLANDLEDLAYLGTAYSKKAAPAAIAAEIAERMGLPALAAALTRAMDAAADAEVPADLRSDRRASVTLPPATYRERLELRLGRRLARLLRR